jgi:type I restriction enzyme S subunit
MRDNWRLTTVGDISKINVDNYALHEKWSYINYLETGGVTDNKISKIQHLKVGVDAIPSRARRKAAVNDILYSTVAPEYCHYGIIKEPLQNMLVSTGFAVIRADKDFIDSDYLYYFLTRYEVVETLQAIGAQSSSVYPSIKPSDIQSLKILLPPMEEQKKIASILSAIEQKIFLNDKINDYLAA